MHDLQCLKTFCTIGEAAAIEAVLEEAGIRCQISEEAGGIWGAQVGSLGSVRVMVATEEIEKATAVLQAHEEALGAEDSLRDQNDGEVPYWDAPAAFAPFEAKKDDDSSEPQAWELQVFGPFWVVYFGCILLLVGVGLYFLVSLLVRL